MAMFPIRCVVETVADSQCAQCSTSGTVIADSYAIVAGQTPLNQLVDTVLAALCLPHLTFGAKGTIQLKNWKPLTFDQISDEPDVDIESVLKDVSNHLTLRILTKQSENAINDCVRDVKDRLLRAVLQKVPNLLMEIPNAQLKDFILQLVQGEIGQTIDVQDIHLFNLWLDEWSKKKTSSSTTANNAAAVASTSSLALAGGHQQQQNQTTASSSSMVASSSSSAGSSTGGGGGGGAGGAGGTAMPPATRFSQLLEVPKLDRWFRETSNPSRQKLLHYMHVLNGSNFRKHTTKITYQQICNWFSNARASHRKRQIRMNNAAAHGNGTAATASGSPAAATVAASNGGWTGKVFGNQVRGLSLAFNDFIQSSGLTQGGQAADSPPGSSPRLLLTAGQQQQQNSDGQSPSASSNASMAIKVEPFGSAGVGDDLSALPMDGVKVNGGSDEAGVDGGADSNCSSPTLAAISAASKSSLNHSGGGGNQILVESTNSTPSRSSLLQSSYAALNPANRTRLMFDPLSELPMLEKYFEENPHPSWVQIDQITEALNGMLYRQTYPPVSSHNVKIWFKNRRAKCKRQIIVADNSRVPNRD